MIITKAKVKNYKNILDSGWVEFEPNITTLLGRNEAGKTAFLEAIKSIENDEPYSSEELNQSSDVGPSSKEPVVLIDFQFEEEDKKALDDNLFNNAKLSTARVIKSANGEREVAEIKTDGIDPSQAILKNKERKVSKIIKKYLSKLENLEDNQPKANLREIIHNFQNTAISHPPELKNALKNFIQDLQSHSPGGKKEIAQLSDQLNNELNEVLNNFDKKLTNILAPEEVVPPIILHNSVSKISDEVSLNEINQETHKTFRNLLKLAGLEEPENLPNMNAREVSRTIDSLNEAITVEINDYWQQKDVEVRVMPHQNVISVQVKDTQIQHHNGEGEKVERSLLPPSSRSDGFQWFFSFQINFSSRVKEKNSGALLLLDDPGVRLHPKGKKDWLNSIEDISENNQILYTTHSPYLIRKEYPSRIRIINDKDDEDFAKVTDQLHETDNLTLKPLRTALGIEYGDSPFVSKRKVIVEGASDYYIFAALFNYFKEEIGVDIPKWEEIALLPAGGAGNTYDSATWVESENFSYVVILDSDKPGHEAAKKIRNDPLLGEERVIKLRKDGKNNFIELEDMFNPEFYIKCVNSVYKEVSGVPNFEEIRIERKEEADEDNEKSWFINGKEYHTGKKILKRIDEIFDEKGYGDFNKIMIAEEIRNRLKSGNVEEKNVKAFKPILQEIREKTPVH